MSREFAACYAEHYGPTMRALTSACGDGDAADDATQEAFARAYAHWSHVSGLSRPQGWLYVTGMNYLRTRFRRQRRYTELASLLDDPTRTEPDSSTRIAVREAVDLLPPRARAAVVLKYVYDLPAVDIAHAMGCDPGTVRSTLSAARTRLRTALHDDQGEPQATAAS